LYVKLSHDKEFPVSMQDRMAKNLGAANIVTIESGHMPMMRQPNELVRVLDVFCSGI
jgi:pimeloyl-ACP methyl ester carboxylesterase